MVTDKILIFYIIDMDDTRFGRLKSAYSDNMTEVYLIFYHAALQMFVNFNKFLQREDPIISIISDQIDGFLKKLLGKFVTVQTIKYAQDITSVQYTRAKSHELDTKVCVLLEAQNC